MYREIAATARPPSSVSRAGRPQPRGDCRQLAATPPAAHCALPPSSAPCFSGGDPSWRKTKEKTHEGPSPQSPSPSPSLAPAQSPAPSPSPSPTTSVAIVAQVVGDGELGFREMGRDSCGAAERTLSFIKAPDSAWKTLEPCDRELLHHSSSCPCLFDGCAVTNKDSYMLNSGAFPASCNSGDGQGQGRQGQEGDQLGTRVWAAAAP